MPKRIDDAFVLSRIRMLGYCTKRQMGDLLYGRTEERDGREGHRNRSTKAGNYINRLFGLGEIDIIPRTDPEIFRYKGLSGGGGKHSLMITDVLIDILFAFEDSIIQREPDFGPGFKRRPDAAVIVRTRDWSHPFILEVMNYEDKESIKEKIKAYRKWDGQWFRDRGADFAGILVIGKIELDEPGVVTAEQFTKELLDYASVG